MSIQNKVESVETVIKPTREEAEEAVRTLIAGQEIIQIEKVL